MSCNSLKNALVLAISAVLILSVSKSLAQFTDVASSAGLDIGGNKDGGMSWADFNNDGCIDLLVNTNDGTNRSRLYQNNCDSPPTFTDVTNSLVPDLLNQTCERTAIWGDFNNDGYIDFARNQAWRVEIYENNGPDASTAWSFSRVMQITTLPGGLNIEGMAWVDFNGDGFLDLMLENHNYGFDIMLNPADCSSNFTHATPNASSLGLPTSASDGDYMASGDYNDDGWVDILARKNGEDDLYRNDGGTFTVMQDFGNANNGNKGAVAFCDFDNDGDFDAFWTSYGTNQIWEQTGVNSGVFVATGEPASSSGVSISGNIDGCGCGDLDNDGDTDLVLTDNSGTSYVFENSSSSGSWSFAQNNNGINVNANAEGVSIVDYDADGDLDVYVNRRNTGNQLWENDTDDDNYLFVEALLNLKAGFTRYDHGATAILKSSDGSTIKSGITDAASSLGHGCQKSGKMHFGLPDGPDASYLLELKYTNIGGSRVQIDTVITPSDFDANTFTYVNSDFGSYSGGGLACNLLPIELAHFTAEIEDDAVELTWATYTETINEYFTLDHRLEGESWEEIHKEPGAINSFQLVEYGYTYESPRAGLHYFRLRQTDTNGDQRVVGLTTARFDPFEMTLQVYPNPLGQDYKQAVWEIGGITSGQELLVEVKSADGQTIYEKTVSPDQNYLRSEFTDSIWRTAGVYIIRVQQGKKQIVERFVVR